MKVKSFVRDYDVTFHSDLKGCLESLKGKEDIAILVDSNVYSKYLASFESTLKSERILVIDALETNKTFEKVGEYILQLLEMNVKKSTNLVVVGGGVIQDIGGFIASIIFRGIDWSLIPTTLLAQCDSCIGSKTSMNIANYKNQLGTFYPPSKVLVTTSVLRTLSKNDLNSGICEAIKLAMIESNEAVEIMRMNLNGDLSDDKFLKIINQALEIKKTYIEKDEKDKGIRNLLNYGHTFGHAFESASAYKIPHGCAVGLGIYAANYFSMKLGLINSDQSEKSKEDILPWCQDHIATLKSLPLANIMNSMKTDKKNTANQIGFILTRGYGKMSREYLDFDKAQILMEEFLHSGI